jgi:hypothetical protein
MSLSWVLLLVIFSVLYVPSELQAEEKDTPGETVQILSRWVQASRTRGPFKATMNTIRYDKLMETVTYSSGTFWVQSPTRWRLDLNPITNTSGGTQLQRRGVTYKIDSSGSERRWIYADGTFYDCVDDRMTSAVLSSRPDWLSVLLYRSLAKLDPLLWICCPDQLMDDVESHRVQMPAERTDAENRIGLTFVSTNRLPSRSDLAIDIILNRKTHLPEAIQIQDQIGNITVFIFSSMNPVQAVNPVVFVPPQSREEDKEK